jgi:hypothetical protein
MSVKFGIQWEDDHVSHISPSEGVVRKVIDHFRVDQVKLVCDEGNGWAVHTADHQHKIWWAK